MCVLKYKDAERADYVPRDIGIGGGDFVKISICLECGIHFFVKPYLIYAQNGGKYCSKK